MGNARKPVPAGGQPTPAAIASADSTPPAGGAASADDSDGDGDSDKAPDDKAPGNNGTADGELVDARVLVAFDDYLPDHVVSASADAIEQLKLDGRADPHPDAVAYARSLQA